MHVTLCNGSPRVKNSNTAILTEIFLEAMSEHGHTYEKHYLMKMNEPSEFIKLYNSAEVLLIAFPLYTFSMPANVMRSFEFLLHAEKLNSPKILYFVQSGFPEAVHSRTLEAYLKKLTKKLGADYLGTIIKGGCENIKSLPEFPRKRFLKQFYELGSEFGKGSCLSEKTLKAFAKPEIFTGLSCVTPRILQHMASITYWNPWLKKNNAYHKRFDRPYQEE